MRITGRWRTSRKRTRTYSSCSVCTGAQPNRTAGPNNTESSALTRSACWSPRRRRCTTCHSLEVNEPVYLSASRSPSNVFFMFCKVDHPFYLSRENYYRLINSQFVVFHTRFPNKPLTSMCSCSVLLCAQQESLMIVVAVWLLRVYVYLYIYICRNVDLETGEGRLVSQKQKIPSKQTLNVSNWLLTWNLRLYIIKAAVSDWRSLCCLEFRFNVWFLPHLF